MIQEAESNELSGSGKIQNFNIELNATVFDMLVSKVYTDKVMAVIREWSTNAIDACIDAKKPINFEVHLPTILEPYFSVRDYGTGLSNEDVLGLYSTLGASTKRNSNEFNGTFGIGRGAGLAYSTRFQVDSYFNGTKISYVVSTDGGMPAMISLGNHPTTEANGLNIQLNVSSKDIEQFRKKAINVYNFFSDKPRTNIELTYSTLDKIIEGKDWYMEVPDSFERYNNIPIAIMGNVAYQIDKSHFTDIDYSAILTTSIRLKVPLGAISITPGRESLSMDEKTVTYLKKRFKSAAKEATYSLIKTLDRFPTTWGKVVGYNKAVMALPYQLRNLVHWVPTGVTRIGSVDRYNKQFLQFHKGPTDSFNGIQFMQYLPKRTSGTEVLASGIQYGRTKNVVQISENVHFMISDTRQGFIDAAKAYRDSLGDNAIVVLIKMEGYSKDGIDEFLTKAYQIIKEIGDPKYVLASKYITNNQKQLAASGRTITATNFAPLTFSRLWNSGGCRASRGKMLSSYTEEQFFYIEMSSYELSSMSKENFLGYFNFFEIYKKQHPEDKFALVGVPKGAMRNIANDPRFVHITIAAKEREDKVSVIDLKPVDDLKKALNEFNPQNFIELTHKLKNREVAADIRIVKDFERKYEKPENRLPTKNIERVLKVRAIIPATLSPIGETMKRYPMIQTLQNDRVKVDNKVDNIARYIELEDCYAAEYDTNS